MIKPLRLHLAAVLLLLLGACSSDRTDEEKQQEKDDIAKAKVEAEARKIICPQVAIMRDLEGVRDYGAEKPDPSEFVAAAKMIAVDGDCEYQEGGADITFNLNFIAAKGPRLGGNRTTFPYFAAVLDPQQNILNKEKMLLEVTFPSDQKTADRSESLHIFIPMTKDQQKAGANYQVLLGFQLTQEQLDALRAERQGKN